MTVDDAMTELADALRTTERQVYRGSAENLQPPCYVLGAPTLTYDTYSTSEPSAITITVYAVGKASDMDVPASLYRSVVPEAVAAIQQSTRGTVTQAVPGSIATGAREFPCYNLTTEVPL